MGRPAPSQSSGTTKYEPELSSALKKEGGVVQRVDEFDKQLSLRVHGGGQIVPRSILKFLEYSGDGLLWIPLPAALWLAPILLDKPELRNFVFNLLVAFLFDLVFIAIIKSIVRRPRPIYNKNMYLVLAVDHYSFPSGHSSRALMIAAFNSFYISMWRRLLAPSTAKSPQSSPVDLTTGVWRFLPAAEVLFVISIWLWALATASSRVLLGRHYVFDVVVGSLLGILEALFVHLVLFVPKHVSQSIHDSVWGIFKQA